MPLHRGEGHLSLNLSSIEVRGAHPDGAVAQARDAGGLPDGGLLVHRRRAQVVRRMREARPHVRGVPPSPPPPRPPHAAVSGVTRRTSFVGSPSRQLARAPLTRCRPRPARNPGASPPGPERPRAPRSAGVPFTSGPNRAVPWAPKGGWSRWTPCGGWAASPAAADPAAGRRRPPPTTTPPAGGCECLPARGMKPPGTALWVPEGREPRPQPGAGG